MSLIQSSVALFFMITIVSCVSFTSPKPAEVKTSTEDGKDNDFFNIVTSALLQRVKMNKINGVQIKARVKKTTDRAREAVKMPPMKLLGLMYLVYKNIFSEKILNGEPPISPDVAVEPFVKLTRHGLEILKESVGHKELF